MDSEIGFVIKDVPYTFLSNLDGTFMRIYIVHDNAVVFSDSGAEVEAGNPDVGAMYLMKPSECLGDALNFFRATCLVEAANQELSINGELIEGNPYSIVRRANFNPVLSFVVEDRGEEWYIPYFMNGEPPTTKDYSVGLEAPPVEFNVDVKLPKEIPQFSGSFYDIPIRRPYDPRVKVNNIHWGQMKLILSEIEFLTQYHSRGSVVLYVGAAPGEHIPLLSSMFPHLLFVLYDPQPFKIQPTDRIILRQRMFEDEEADAFADAEGILFISDIRTPKPNVNAGMSKEQRKAIDQQHEKNIIENMEAQQAWVDQIKPEASMLKFRLPFPGFVEGDSMAYLDGHLRMQIFPREYSTEMRLWVEKTMMVDGEFPRRVYDLKEVEEKCFGYNTMFRPARFNHPFAQVSMDMYRAAAVIDEYLATISGESTNDRIFKVLYDIETVINRDHHPHQLTDLLVKRERPQARPQARPRNRKPVVVLRQQLSRE